MGSGREPDSHKHLVREEREDIKRIIRLRKLSVEAKKEFNDFIEHAEFRKKRVLQDLYSQIKDLEDKYRGKSAYLETTKKMQRKEE